MKRLLLSLALVVIGIATASGYSDYLYPDQPLIQAKFDRLIPTSSPTIQVSFDNLIPTTRPLIYPDAPQVHIIDNLIHPTDQQLLIVKFN